MTKEELKQIIFDYPKPSNWRDGQFVFNYIDEFYGIARYLQFEENIDCFYDNSKIDSFIEKAAELITEFNL